MHSFNPPSESKAQQCALVLALLRTGPQTTLDLRAAGVMSPAARIYSARKAGHPIETLKTRQLDDQGRSHPVAKYVLLPGGVA